MSQYDGSERDSSQEGYRGHRNGGMYGGASQPKPVKVGDEIEVKIEGTASKGDGIAKKDGFVIFISGAKEGDTVKVKIKDVKERFATAELIS
ncbi:MAG: TRAM domain-containing protein [Candidatus Micrarchaeaceae archaeon]